jgi:hypothetical protein
VTPRPTRATAAGQTYLDLRRLASASRRPTDELFQLYALEGFLDRLSRSAFAGQFVLKGGVLLAAFDARRPTRDIDFAVRAMANELIAVRTAVVAILAVRLEDGLTFDVAATTADVIREEDDYSGVRVTVLGQLSTARVQFHVDVNIGDPIWPAPTDVEVPRLLGGDALRVVGYPVAMILAEKIVTALQRGTANTRWRDFVDIARLSEQSGTDVSEIQAAIVRVADHRRVQVRPLSDALDGFAPLAQPRWRAWRRKQRLEATTPEDFAELLARVVEFSDRVLREPPNS